PPRHPPRRRRREGPPGRASYLYLHDAPRRRAQGLLARAPASPPVAVRRSPLQWPISVRAERPVKLDVGMLTHDLKSIPSYAREVESLGYECLWSSGSQHDPSLPLRSDDAVLQSGSHRAAEGADLHRGRQSVHVSDRGGGV